MPIKLKKRRGATTITLIGVGAVIMLFALFFLELLQMYDYQYAIEIRAQRAINSTVEYAMDDRWRSDGFNYMNVQNAQATLHTYLNEDLNVDGSGRCYDANGNLLYSVSYGTPTYSSGKNSINSAGIKMDIKVTMHSGLGAAFGVLGGKFTWTNHFDSTNFRTDDNERAGWIFG